MKPKNRLATALALAALATLVSLGIIRGTQRAHAEASISDDPSQKSFRLDWAADFFHTGHTGPAAPKLGASAGERIYIMAGGLKRTAMLFGSERPPKDGATLLVVFHGHNGNAAEFAEKTNLPTLWPEAYIVFPQG